MKRLLLIICMLYQSSAFSQEMWGIANSNFAGSAGMSLNPTSMMLMPYKWEVTLISGDISFQNNYVGYKRKSESTTLEGTPDPHRGVVDYYTPGDKSASQHLLLKLPAFTFRTPTLAFGFHAAVRNDFSIRHVPAPLAKFAYEGLFYSPLYGTNIQLDGIRAGAMTWMEAGFSVGKALGKNPEKKWVGAITLKYIGAIQGASMHIENGSMNIANDSSVVLSNINAEMNTAVPEDGNQVFAFPNKGIATDIGFCYVSNPNHEHFENGKSVTTKKYDYRIGISLIDLGFVSFKRNAINYHLNNVSATFDRDATGTDSILDANETNERFVMSLPTALSIQYDRCLVPKVFVNLSAIQRIPMPMERIDRANQLSATLRYETTYFEVAIPYSFYDYYLHRIGIAVRYGIIFLGTDKVGAFIHNDEITGVDFYFGLRLTNLDFVSRKKPAKKVCPAFM